MSELSFVSKRANYSVTIMCKRKGQEAQPQIEKTVTASSILDCMDSSVVKLALLNLPKEIVPVGILIYEVGK